MKPKLSALQTYAEPSGVESEDLDETVDLPALFLPGDVKDCNDDDAGPSPYGAERPSPLLIELGESINKNLERIATALEKLPSELSQNTGKKKVARKPATTRKKRVTSQQKPRKTKAKKATSKS